MKNFKNIINLPISQELYDCFLDLMEKKIIKISFHNQICINAPKGKEDDYELGTGSLYYDWSAVDEKKIKSKDEIPPRKKIYEEQDFTELCNVFKNTPFEEVYFALKNRYSLGRVRIMINYPKTCLSWHTDTSPRLHFPMKTQEGCLMVIDDEVYHLPKNQWTLTNTTLKHTAFNASFEERIHLVASILDNYED